MATVVPSESTVAWGSRVTFRGEGWTPGAEVSIGGRYTVPREDGSFDMTNSLSPVDESGEPVTGPYTLTFDDGAGNKVDVAVTLE